MGMAPYLTTFNVSWTRTIAAFLHMGAVDLPALVGIVLGGPAFTAAHPGTPAGLRAQLDFLPGGCEWTVCTYLGDVLEVAETVIDRGGHLSIGLGDHPHTRLGRPTNAELVHRVAELARARGREVATPEEARRMLGLPLRRSER
ncbi:3-keto-5-aminohexanoate cleavage protein [Streptosporangium longisporum]|uniref:3-keto-5-aminohexanoate cleavage protein n=1 Tax=Streptosporangium longisporum TaxID=46187 RepID=UPI003CD05A98